MGEDETRFVEPGLDDHRPPGHEEALAAFWAALATPAEVDADEWMRLAGQLVAYRLLNEALNALERVVAIAPDHARAFQLRASVLAALGRHVEALLSYQRCLERQPGSVSAWHG